MQDQELPSTSDFIYDEPLHSLSSTFTDIQMVPSCGYSLLAKAMREGRWWMLKGLKPEYRDVQVFRDALHKEYDVMCHIQHPAIVSVEAFEEVPLLGPCIVMEYVEGMNLRDALTRGLPLDTRLRVAREILDAVGHLHRKQIVHRDLKPSNIMLVGETGYVKIIDFGLSDGHLYTYLKMPSGTLRYMSPEQQKSDQPDIRNDIYSLGCVLDDLSLGRRYKHIVNRCKLPLTQRYDTVDAMLYDFDRAGRKSAWRWLLPLASVLVLLVLLAIRYHWMDDVYRLAHSIDLTAYDFEEGGLYYNVLSDDEGTVELTHNGHTNAYRGDITIPEYVEHNGRNYKVVRVGDEAFRLTTDLDAIVLPQTLRSLGQNAFMQSDRVATLYFPDSITQAGDSLIRNCSFIRSVRLPLMLNEVPPYCFSGCWNLRTITLHEGIKALRRDAFAGTAIDSITFPRGLRVIDRGVFWECRHLKLIRIPASVERIGDFVFWGCDSLRHVYVQRPQPLPITNIFQDLEGVTLHVPKGSAQAYMQASGWNTLNVVEEL